MSAVEVLLPVQVPGEDILNPPFPPIPASALIGSAEFGGPLRHDGWTPARPEWEDLTTEEAVKELRLGSESEFFAAFEGDPVVVAECPSRIHPGGAAVVTAEGICPDCGYDFMSGTRILPALDNLRDIA